MVRTTILTTIPSEVSRVSMKGGLFLSRQVLARLTCCSNGGSGAVQAATVSVASAACRSMASVSEASWAAELRQAWTPAGHQQVQAGRWAVSSSRVSSGVSTVHRVALWQIPSLRTHAIPCVLMISMLCPYAACACGSCIHIM